jgi:hypothetical protein
MADNQRTADSRCRTTGMKIMTNRYCLACQYPLRSLASDSPACPECGRAFDPDDPTTYAQSPRGWLHIAGRWLRRSALLGVVMAIVTTGYAVAYSALVKSDDPGSLISNPHSPANSAMLPKYKMGGRAAYVIFAPVHWVDRQHIRPQKWYGGCAVPWNTPKLGTLDEILLWPGRDHFPSF